MLTPRKWLVNYCFLGDNFFRYSEIMYLLRTLFRQLYIVAAYIYVYMGLLGPVLIPGCKTFRLGRQA